MTKGQIERRISEIVSKFESEYMGRGPNKIKTKIFDDVIFVRLSGCFTPAEQILAEQGHGIEPIKKMKALLFENIADKLKAMIKDVIDADIKSVYSDISTQTGEKIIIFIFVQNIEQMILNT